jgi:hypothetical protein
MGKDGASSRSKETVEQRHNAVLQTSPLTFLRTTPRLPMCPKTPRSWEVNWRLIFPEEGKWGLRTIQVDRREAWI